jgi:hypothetical protein
LCQREGFHVKSRLHRWKRLSAASGRSSVA